MIVIEISTLVDPHIHADLESLIGLVGSSGYQCSVAWRQDKMFNLAAPKVNKINLDLIL